jgi:hypothetical protein
MCVKHKLSASLNSKPHECSGHGVFVAPSHKTIHCTNSKICVHWLIRYTQLSTPWWIGGCLLSSHCATDASVLCTDRFSALPFLSPNVSETVVEPLPSMLSSDLLPWSRASCRLICCLDPEPTDSKNLPVHIVRLFPTFTTSDCCNFHYISLTLHQLLLFPLALHVAGSIDPFLPLKHHQGMW